MNGADNVVPAEKAEDIVKTAMQTRSDLLALDHQLQEEIDEIVLTAARAGNPLSDADKARRRELRARQLEVDDSFEELAFATLARLNNSADLVELKKKIDAISGNLEDDLTHLKNIAKYAAIEAKVADGLAQLALKAAAALAP